MRIKLNDQWINLPSSLSEITLKQRIDFQIQHGNLLDEMAKSILSLEDTEERMLELTQFQFEKMFRSFAFFAGTTVEAVKESEFLDTIANLYYSSLKILFEDEDKLVPKHQFLWNKELWYLQAPELKNGDRMTFGELIDSKQIIQDLSNLGKSQWEALLPLCCIYLKRKDEIYEESFLYEDSDRMKLMEMLPLDIALQVGFFLSGSLNMFMKTSPFLNPQGLKTPERISKNTLKTMVG